MKKSSAFLVLTWLMACGENSSPEGRMSRKIAEVQAQIDSLKQQNTVILDSLGKINETLRNISRE